MTCEQAITEEQMYRRTSGARAERIPYRIAGSIKKAKGAGSPAALRELSDMGGTDRYSSAAQTLKPVALDCVSAERPQRS